MGSIGDKAKVAPSDLATLNCLTESSMTVPMPSATCGGNSLRSPASTLCQSLLSNVTSIALHPIDANSIPRFTATSGDPLARKIGNTPAAFNNPKVVSISLFAASSLGNTAGTWRMDGVPRSRASTSAKRCSAARSSSPLTREKSPTVSWHKADRRSARRSAESVEIGATCKACIRPAAHALPPPHSSFGMCKTGNARVLHSTITFESFFISVSKLHRHCNPPLSRVFRQTTIRLHLHFSCNCLIRPKHNASSESEVNSWLNGPISNAARPFNWSMDNMINSKP
mmetsp:Transcript_64093/g.101692  ORF Transcript_64093/g.101692 Transcript_64093/m.101692 type:complete len:284 (+) Transcript_64093:323-1174(+)